ncbi:hypothetical protein [Streptomyces coffeae]|nr:hypothetical protein [Streptomyces coffeae]
MTAASPPSTRPHQRPSRTGTVITSLILCLGHTVTGYLEPGPHI